MVDEKQCTPDAQQVTLTIAKLGEHIVQTQAVIAKNGGIPGNWRALEDAIDILEYEIHVYLQYFDQ